MLLIASFLLKRQAFHLLPTEGKEALHQGSFMTGLETTEFISAN